MRTAAESHPWGTLFTIQGEVDHLEGRRLFEDLYRCLNGPLVIDASGIEYIDTGGIAAIMEILKHVRNRQGLVVIAGATPHVGEIFEIAGFGRLRPWLVMAPTVEEAIRLAREWRRAAPSASQPASGS